MKTFLLPHDIGEILNLLTDSEAGQIIKAVFDYEINSVEPEFSDRTMQIVFFDIKRFLDSNRENYEKVCRQRSEYAKKRWEKHNEVNSNLSDMHEDAQACLSMHKHTAVGNSNNNSNSNCNSNSDSNCNSNTEQTSLQKSADTYTDKKAYGMFSNVYLTDEEYGQLLNGFEDAKRRIDSFSAYMRSSGKEYNDHYARLISWNCYDNGTNSALLSTKHQKQPGERREPTFDVSEFTKKAINIKYVPPEEE